MAGKDDSKHAPYAPAYGILVPIAAIVLSLPTILVGIAWVAATQREQDAKQGQRDTLYTYYRTGNMTETDLTRQLALISAEQVQLASQIVALTRDLAAADATAARLAGVDAFLADLLAQYDAAHPLTRADQRRILEQFVADMTVVTQPHPETGEPWPVVKVLYTFERPESAGHVLRTPSRTSRSSTPRTRR